MYPCKTNTYFYTTLIVIFSWFTAPLYAEILRPAPPTINAESYILIDAQSKEVLIESNAQTKLPPASLTKIMTSYVIAYELDQGNISESDMVPISVKAWKKPGSKMFIREGTKVSLHDLIRGIMIQSGNDASIAVAEYIAGSEEAFGDLMNQHALSIGMKNSNFRNSTGWPDPEHLTTAEDLALLAQALISKFPDHYSIYSQKSYTYNEIKQKNRNVLLHRDDSIDGIKTGYTEKAGYCLVSSAKREGMRLISVVMGTKSPESRARESQKLLSYGFRFYETLTPHLAEATLNTSKIWMSEAENINLGVQENISVTVPRGKAAELKTVLDIPSEIRAPIKKGDTIGSLMLKLGEDVLIERDLVALEPHAEASFFKRIWHGLYLFVLNLF